MRNKMSEQEVSLREITMICSDPGKIQENPSPLLEAMKRMSDSLYVGTNELFGEATLNKDQSETYRAFCTFYINSMRILMRCIDLVHSGFNQMPLSQEDLRNLKEITKRLKDDQKEYDSEQKKRTEGVAQTLMDLDFMIAQKE